MSIRKGSFGGWEVVDDNDHVVAVLDSSEEAIAIMNELKEVSESSNDDDLFGLF